MSKAQSIPLFAWKLFGIRNELVRNFFLEYAGARTIPAAEAGGTGKLRVPQRQLKRAQDYPGVFLIQRKIMFWKSLILLAASASLAPAATKPFPLEQIATGISVVRGPVNGVLIERNGETLAIYGDPRPEPVRAR